MSTFFMVNFDGIAYDGGWCSGRDFQRIFAFEPASLTYSKFERPAYSRRHAP